MFRDSFRLYESDDRASGPVAAQISKLSRMMFESNSNPKYNIIAEAMQFFACF